MKYMLASRACIIKPRSLKVGLVCYLHTQHRFPDRTCKTLESTPSTMWWSSLAATF